MLISSSEVLEAFSSRGPLSVEREIEAAVTQIITVLQHAHEVLIDAERRVVASYPIGSELDHHDLERDVREVGSPWAPHSTAHHNGGGSPSKSARTSPCNGSDFASATAHSTIARVGLLEDILAARDNGELPLHLAVQIDAPLALETAWKTEAIEEVLEVAWLIGQHRKIFEIILSALRFAHESWLGHEAYYEAEIASCAVAKIRSAEKSVYCDPIYARKFTEKMIALLTQYLGGQLSKVEMEQLGQVEMEHVVLDVGYDYYYRRRNLSINLSIGSRIADVAWEATFATTSRDKPNYIIEQLSAALGSQVRAHVRGLRGILPTPTRGEIFALFDLGPH
jgi:hypothetical protein